jgi:hypothetical protein
MCDNKFEKINFDNCVFVKRYSSDDFIILLLYVVDIFVVRSDLKKIKKKGLKVNLPWKIWVRQDKFLEW